MSTKRAAAVTDEATEGPTQKRAKTEANAGANSAINIHTNANANGNGTGTGTGNGGMAEWTKVEKRKKKKQNKKEAALTSSSSSSVSVVVPGVVSGGQQLKAVAHPRFLYANQEILRRNHAIAIDDIRDLVLHLVADGPSPNWLRVDNANMIQKVVTLLVPGLTPELLSLPPLPTSATVNPNLPISIPLHPPPPPPTTSPSSSSSSGGATGSRFEGLAASIPFIASTFSHACPTRAPGDQSRMHSVLSSFFTGPISGEERKRRIAQRVMLSEANKSDPTRYVLSLEQMIENDYPIPSYMADVFEKPPGWVETPEPPQSESAWVGQRKIYAIDCEMCLTEDGKELTRVCVIDFHTGQVVYDQLVKPEKPIVDYLTRWSGITAEQLANVTTRHAEVQARIMQLLTPSAPAPNPFSISTSPSPSAPTPSQQPQIPPTPILLGHSLESDLKTLKITHPLCIDTALIFHHPRGKPLKPGLAWLTKKWCGREIQTRGEGGHDPEEDARACMELLRKKLENGPGFGEFKMDYESIFERMGRRASKGGGAGVKSAVVDVGNPGVMHGSKATTAIGCKSDEDVLKGVLEVVPAHDFVFGRFMGLANVLGWVTPKAGNATVAVEQEAAPQTPTTTVTTPATTFEMPPKATLTPILETLNTHLKTIHDALPPRTALVIFTGHSDPRRMAALNARKVAFEQALRAGPGGNTNPELPAGVSWSAQDGRDLEEAVEVAKRGLMFLGVKN